MGINKHKVARRNARHIINLGRGVGSLYNFFCFVVDTLYIYTFMKTTVIDKKKLLFFFFNLECPD